MDYDDATKFAQKRRHGAPAIYNPDRIAEQPIPTLQPRDDTNESGNDIFNGSQMNEMDQSAGQKSIGDANLSEEAAFDTANSISNHFPILSLVDVEHSADEEDNNVEKSDSVDAITHDLIAFENSSENSAREDQSTNIIQVQVGCSGGNENKVQSPVLDDLDPLHDENSADDPNNSPVTGESNGLACGGLVEHELATQIELVLKVEPHFENEDLLDELIYGEMYSVEKVGDDMEIIVNKRVGFARPFAATKDELIKRENDVVSGEYAICCLGKFFSTTFRENIYTI